MKKALILLLALLVLAFPGSAFAKEEDPIEDEWREQMEKGIAEQISGLRLDDLNKTYFELEPAERDMLGAPNIVALITDIATGKIPLEFNDFMKYLWNSLLTQASKSMGLIVKAIVLALLCGLLTNLRSSFSGAGVGEAAYFVCYSFIVAIVIQSITSTLRVATGAINSMTGLMQGMFPVLLTTLSALGGAASASVISPAMAALSGGIGTFIKDVILPLSLVCSALIVISNISERVQIKKLSEFALNAAQWAVGIVFTVYVAIITTQGMTAGAIDGISIRTAKYTIDKFVPVAGKMIADSVDTILGCTLIVKNAAGMAGVVMLVLTVAAPIIEILATVLVFRLGAAVIEPVADKRLVDCLSELSKVLVFLAVAVLSVGIMAYITISLAVSTGNVNLMMR